MDSEKWFYRPGPGRSLTDEQIRQAVEFARGGRPALKLIPPYENWQLRRSGGGGWTIVDAEGRDITPTRTRFRSRPKAKRRARGRARAKRTASE